jgi:hypothetical protein
MTPYFGPECGPLFSLPLVRGFKGGSTPLSLAPLCKAAKIEKRKKRKKVGSEDRMFSARNQIRWFEEEWRRANEREVEEVEEVEKVEKIEEPVLQVVAKVSEPVVAEVDEEGAKVAENHAKHLENLRKYFARTTESTTMAIPVHRQKATR